jgi:hypothetical protein
VIYRVRRANLFFSLCLVLVSVLSLSPPSKSSVTRFSEESFSLSLTIESRQYRQEVKAIKLEEQLAKLAELGLKFDDGISIEDVLYSFDRKDYEERPYDLILFVLGIEVERAPWGRSVCSRVWNFDTECIDSTGDYVRIVKRLCRVAGRPDCVTDVNDFVDIEAGRAWLRYKVNGTERNWSVKVKDDWADTLTVKHVMKDIERDGYRFYFKDNGQAMVLFYLDSKMAADLNRLSNNALKPVLAE